MTTHSLIVWGGWHGHQPEACARIVGEMLEDAGSDIELASATRVFADPALTDFDLIVPILTMSEIAKDERDGLCGAVRRGTGLGGFHGGMCDAFRGSPEYQFMCGGQWVAHPGDIIDYRVDILPVDDPITAGIASFDYRSEQYYMHVDPAIEVLATTTFSGAHAAWIEGTVMPVVWKHRYGAGRVFFSALGHTASEFEVPQMREILRRGLLWAMRDPAAGQ